MNRIARRLTVGLLALSAAAINFTGAQAAFASPAASAVGGVSLQPLHQTAGSAGYFTFQSAAGSTLSDAVVITNHATSPVDLAVTAVDGLTGQTWTHSMNLHIPANAHAGTYTSTWTYTLASAP